MQSRGRRRTILMVSAILRRTMTTARRLRHMAPTVTLPSFLPAPSTSFSLPLKPLTTGASEPSMSLILAPRSRMPMS